jgi:hypothetical protein
VTVRHILWSCMRQRYRAVIDGDFIVALSRSPLTFVAKHVAAIGNMYRWRGAKSRQNYKIWFFVKLLLGLTRMGYATLGAGKAEMPNSDMESPRSDASFSARYVASIRSSIVERPVHRSFRRLEYFKSWPMLRLTSSALAIFDHT